MEDRPLKVIILVVLILFVFIIIMALIGDFEDEEIRKDCKNLCTEKGYFFEDSDRNKCTCVDNDGFYYFPSEGKE